jgi:parallel beta-helix repeat protein
MSYVRLDDKYEEGRLTELRERLESEVKMQTGRPFPIFQDREDIRWGQNWKLRIGDSLDAATFLIPIVTPSFFESDACREELRTFLERESELGRADLVLPIYYVGVPALEDPEREGEDQLVDALRLREWADWRDLRFEAPSSPAVARKFVQLALQIRETLQEHGPKLGAPPRPHAPRVAAEQGTGAQQATRDVPSSRREPRRYVVDPFMRGDFPSIGEAIAKAEPGSRIFVRPGSYRESLVIDKPIELIGDGDVSEIAIQGESSPAIRFSTTMGRIANFTIRQLGGQQHAVDIAQGRLEVEDCEISGYKLASVGIHETADPRLRRNRIHSGQSGVFVYEQGLGLVEENDIHESGLSGVEIKEGSNPTIRRNRIHDNVQNGILVHEHGLGLLEENEIYANGLSGLEIRIKSKSTVRSNRIHHNKWNGINAHDEGSVNVDSNEIFENGSHGVSIRTSTTATLRRNVITRNTRAGIRVDSTSTVVAEGNDLRGNAGGSWSVEDGATVQKANNEEGELP